MMTWLPNNPYPEKISNDADSTMISNVRHTLWQEGMMCAAGTIAIRGQMDCPHGKSRMRSCDVCWENLFKEIGL